MRKYHWQAIAICLITILVTAGFALFTKAAPGAPTIPHPITGRQQCLLCHSASGPSPAPANHSTFTESACLSCHTLATSPSTSSNTTGSVSPAGGCESCHGKADLSMTLASGEKLALYVDPKIFAASIHGDKLLCTDCHASITGYPHPSHEIADRRDYNITQYEICKRCHFDNYTKTLDSAHYDMLTKGFTGTPLCTDCHGAHDVTSPSQPRTRISQTCSKCHQIVYNAYVDSIHGKALITGNNFDVPVCTDCHLSHTIEDARTAGFRIASVDLCVKCHSNEKLMQKYGISTSVVKTYLQDFHGASVALVARQNKEVWPEEAVCTDCHGVHDIKSPDDPDSSVIKANLVNTCRNCHPDATANFPSAWLSHYEPSLDKAPTVFYVRWFYRILIPFIVIGLAVHISVDIWKVVTNR